MTNNAAECLLCHTVHTVSLVAHPDNWWRCSRCGQQWDAARIATVTDYRRRVAESAVLQQHAAA
jgi:hypothetical protein